MIFNMGEVPSKESVTMYHYEKSVGFFGTKTSPGKFLMTIIPR